MDYSPETFVETTGVLVRRFSDKLTTSDLCFEAAKPLLFHLIKYKSQKENQNG